MKLQTSNPGFANQSVNVNNIILKFENGIATIDDDELGQQIVKDHDWIWPEGKVQVKEQKEKIDIYDQALVSKLSDKIAKLDMSLKDQRKKVESLQESNKDWRRKYQEVFDQNEQLKQDLDLAVKEVVLSMFASTEPEAMRVFLEDANIQKLRDIGGKIKLDSNTVENKKTREGWIEAIISHLNKA